MTQFDSIQIVAQVLAGSRLALARALTWIENDTPAGRDVLDRLFPYTGRAHLVGVTGAPGTGKSSLVNQIARFYRLEEADHAALKVGIVAVDPSSPFTGGAILGDRVRMRDLSGDPGVFIRSMASRGTLGGLAAATAGAVQALDAAGFELILIETVGAGQAEVEIARLAHTILVVEAPGLGDEIQAIKAGILEIADILVVNKADRPGVENTERALRNMLQLAHPVRRAAGLGDGHHHRHVEQPENLVEPAPQPGWIPPVLRTVATEGEGIAALGAQIQAHRQFLQSSGELRERDRARLQSELDNLIRATLVKRWRNKLPEPYYQAVIMELVERKISPWQALENLLETSQL